MTARARNRNTGALQRMKTHWWDFKTGTPGRRFKDRYRRRQREGHGPVMKFLSLGFGLVVFAIGLVLLPAPGPGFLVVFPGAVLIAEESYLAARAFDWIEVKLRALAAWSKRAWKRASIAMKTVVVVGTIVLAVGAGFVAYEVVFA